MGILEQVTQMKNQGMGSEEIVNNLKEQGISPKEIDDALSQSQIKNAVSDIGTQGMQPSTIESPTLQDQGNYMPQTQELPEAPRMGEETYTPSPQEYSQPQEFYQQDDSGGYSTGGVDSMIEVSEQVFSEKIREIQKKVEGMNEFKTLAQTKIEDIANRLKRIETTIDKLQIAILEKIGSYGKNLDGIKKEMSMMQDSFGKVVNQAVSAHKAHTTHKTPSRKKTSKKK